MVRLWLAVAAVLALTIGPAAADRRVAFVVGNAKYEKVEPLRNAQRDAAAMADRLRDLGFEVTEVFDGDAFTLNRAAERFVAQAKGADLSLFYFAGHGIQLFDRNFLLARDVDPARITRPEEIGLDLARFMDGMRRSGTVRQVLLIDACRDNPFSFEETVRVLDLVRNAGQAGGPPAATAARAASRGLATVALPGRGGATGETMLFFAAQPGAVSFDGTGQNSYFVESLKEELAKPDRPLTEVFRAVSGYVRTVTNGEQVPQVVSDWTADVVLRGAAVERVSYDVQAAVGNRRPLTAADRTLITRAATGYGKFKGDFIARASLGELPDPTLTEAEQKRAKELGLVSGFSVRQDLDRDGRDETLHVFFRQFGYVLAIESAGVRAEFNSCIGDNPESIEIALKDINGDRRPEVWISYESGGDWGTFCILEFTGLPKLADLRRGATGTLQLGHAAFRTLLRGNAGWNVTVANDNTIKVCAGTGCHTSWTYTYDGRQFRLVVDEGATPTGGAALPFGDERERAANIYAGLARGGPTLQASPWQTGQPRDNTIAVTTRIGRRTELSYECSPAQAGHGIALEHLALRDKPSADAHGGADVAVQDTLAYGPSLSQAPLVIDGKTCLLDGLASNGEQGIHLSPADPEACFGALARAGTVTLPVLYQQNALLKVRLGAGGDAIGSAREACRTGRLAALGSRPQAATAPLTAPAAVPPATGLEARARAFAEDYMRRSEAPAAEVLGLVRTLFAPAITYYGKRLSNAQVAEEKRRYLARWPQRRYHLKTETLQVACDREQVCNIAGALDYHAGNPADGRVSAGSAVFGLRVQFTGGRPVILEESGRTLARRN